MNDEIPIPDNSYCLLHLPVCAKSEKSVETVIGNTAMVIDSCNRSSDISISIYPENPLIGKTKLHPQPSNKLILKVVKDDSSTSCSIVGRVKSEYKATDLIDFMYLPDRQFYDTVGEGIVPHFDLFDKSMDSNYLYSLPIQFTPYTSPYDINMRDAPNDKEKTTNKWYLFISSDDEIPTIPREGIPTVSDDSPLQPYLKYVTELLQNQPIWDKRYLNIEVEKHFPEESCSSVRTSVNAVMPYLGYVFVDGPFKNVWLRLGYNPATDTKAWIYQYVEFRFSKHPQLKGGSKGNNNQSLPMLYNIELSLHNRYPLCILQSDRDMQQLISRITPNTVYDKKTGWINATDFLQVRNLLKKQAQLLLDKNGYDSKTTIFSQNKRRIQSRGKGLDGTPRKQSMSLYRNLQSEKNKSTPAFSGSTDSLIKEMPLDLVEGAFAGNDDDGSDNGEEGFELFGDEEGDNDNMLFM